MNRRAILERKDRKKSATKTAGEDVEMVDVRTTSSLLAIIILIDICAVISRFSFCTLFFWLSSHHHRKTSHVCMPLRICYAIWAAGHPRLSPRERLGIPEQCEQFQMVMNLLYCTRRWVSYVVS